MSTLEEALKMLGNCTDPIEQLTVSLDKKLSDTQCIELVEQIDNNVVILELEGNGIGPKGAKVLAQMLQRDTKMKILRLYNNSVSDQGAEYLAEALKFNHSLHRITLSKNSITDTGAIAIANALKYNTGLKHLYLWGNSLTRKSVIVFEEALVKHNATLITFDCEEMPLTITAELSKNIYATDKKPLKVCYPELLFPLLLAREKYPNSCWYKDNLPLDLFKLIAEFAQLGKIPADWHPNQLETETK